jgi:predicted nucleic acid-binding protein
MYLLDTSTLIHVLRGNANVAAHVASLPSSVTLYTSVIAEGELLAGVHRLIGARWQRELLAVRATLDRLTVLPVTSALADRYGKVRAGLGAGLRNDGWIAATALERGLVLVADDDDFGRVLGLTVENWAR